MLSFFPLDVLDEIWDLIESVSEGFLTYSFIPLQKNYRKKKHILIVQIAWYLSGYITETHLNVQYMDLYRVVTSTDMSIDK